MNSVTYAGKSHPKPSANIFSKLTFGWLAKLFYKGYRKSLEIRDIYETLDHNKSEVVGDKLEANWKLELIKREKTPKYKPSLLKALIKTFYRSMILEFIFVFIIECVFRVLNPYLLGRLLVYFNEIDENNSMSPKAYYAAGLLLLNTFISAFVINHSNKQRALLGMRLRIACCSVLYRKILRLNQSALGKTSIGQITNLLSNDVNRFDMLFAFIYYFPIVPFQVALITYLLFESLSYGAFAGVLLLALQTIPVQGYVAKISAKLRLRIANLTDSRVVLMNEIVSGIQVLKMYAWEKPFEEFVRLARLKEVNIIRIASYIKGLNSASMVFTERTTIFVAAITYTYLGNVITADRAFAMAQYFNILQCTLALYYPTAILLGAEGMVSIRRLETFFLLEEQETKKIDSMEKISTQNTRTGDINIKNVTASWVKGFPTLQNITTKIRPGELCAIIGPVGSGKSSLLNTILREIIPNEGTINVNGVVSYSCQEPWLFVGSVRNNILFGLQYERRKYQRVVEACSLKQDFVQFPYGDRTVIGDKGASLSGGQKARINLARAVYREADIYLLDDPLSAVDTHVGKHLFNECIQSYLNGKTRILVTHQIQHLQGVNHIIVMQNGKIEAEGSYAELMAQKLEFIKYFDSDDKKNDEEPINEEEKKIIPKLTRQNTEYSIGRPSGIVENMPMSEEEMETGSLNNRLYFDYFKAGGNICQRLLLIIFLIIGQIICSANDYWLSYWTQLERDRYNEHNGIKIVDVNGTIVNQNPDEERYTYDYDDTSFGLLSTNEAVYIYAGLIILVILATSVRAVYFYRICMNSSINLHNTMFNKLLQSPMRFFDKNPIGRILNRFSKDTGAVDELLPKALIDSTQIFSVMIGILVLVSVVNPILLIPIAILLICFIKIRTIFVATAQDLKRLEGITRSPVFSHSSSTLSGLTTIRACNAQDALQVEFDLHQDLHTSTWYLFVVTGIALGLWVDILCVIFLAIVMFSFIIAGNLIFSASSMGLALSQCMILVNMVQYGIKQSVEVVCQMTSVERMLQYTKLETEGPFETSPDKPLRKTWPEKGDLKFDKLYMKYDENEPAILKNLKLNIKPTEKIGIVGRTGAGKSSLISSLFHLSIIDGDIIIDGINIRDIGLHDLRSRISIIPQQPVLFSATMRFNLDPFNLYTDGALWEALEEVELKDAIPSLDFEIQSGGTNFSIGQRQLICLARAILKQNKILVLDEATANVDPNTDSFIQETIRSKFSNCTVLTIAHRLNTIMDSDKVLVMDAGVMAEYDHPYKLLQNKQGIFYSLVEQTGVSMSEHLYNVAKESYIQKFELHFEENALPNGAHFSNVDLSDNNNITDDNDNKNDNPTTHL